VLKDILLLFVCGVHILMHNLLSYLFCAWSHFGVTGIFFRESYLLMADCLFKFLDFLCQLDHSSFQDKYQRQKFLSKVLLYKLLCLC
jgi:hypothetical protein